MMWNWIGEGERIGHASGTDRMEENEGRGRTEGGKALLRLGAITVATAKRGETDHRAIQSLLAVHSVVE